MLRSQVAKLEKLVENSSADLDEYTPSSSNSNSSQVNRELTLEDMEFGEFQGNGACNIVFEVFLPDWWHQQRAHEANDKDQTETEKEKFVVKLSYDHDYGENDFFILETLNSDDIAARKNKIMPIYYAGRNITNPFYLGLDEDSRRVLPTSKDSHAKKSFLSTERIWAHIVPLYDDDDYGDIMEIHDKDLGAIQRFMKSYLEMLDYAHSLGINNNDLSNSNVYLDRSDNLPMIADWNGYLPKGGPLYVSNANWQLVAPEALLRKYNGQQLTVTSVGAYDVWIVGYISFADALLHPTGCKLMRPSSHKDRSEFLKELILAIGGSTLVPVDEHSETDLAEAVGLNRSEVSKRPFTLPIKETSSCSRQTLQILEDQTDDVREMAMDLLQNMLKIDPRERKTCKELLQHPFFKEEF